QKTLEPWERRVLEVDGSRIELPRRAGLSSFGVGGANAHVIVEEAPTRQRDTHIDERLAAERPAHLLTITARTDYALRLPESTLYRHLETHPYATLSDICFSANVGRKHFEQRLALPIKTREQLIAALDAVANGRESAGVVRREPRHGSARKVAFLFTG